MNQESRDVQSDALRFALAQSDIVARYLKPDEQIEGFGFGTTPGKVRFPRIGGGTVDVTVADSDWTLFTIATAAPESRKRSVIARPIPCAPPTTNATRSAKRRAPFAR